MNRQGWLTISLDFIYIFRNCVRCDECDIFETENKINNKHFQGCSPVCSVYRNSCILFVSNEQYQSCLLSTLLLIRRWIKFQLTAAENWGQRQQHINLEPIVIHFLIWKSDLRRVHFVPDKYESTCICIDCTSWTMKTSKKIKHSISCDLG